MSREEAYSGAAVLEVMAEARNYNQYLLSLIESLIRPGDVALDFGAGSGTLALPLKKSGIDVLCVEPDAALHAALKAQGMRVVRKLDEIPDGGVDCLYTLNVLEHIVDDEGTIRALADKLKPGGRMLIYVPAFQILYSTFDRRIGHLRRYRRRALADTVAATGLALQKATYVDCLGFIAALLYRMVATTDGNLSLSSVKIFDRWIFPVSRIMDTILWRFIGKNVLVIATKR